MSNRCGVLWPVHQLHVSTLSGWGIGPIRQVMGSLRLSATGIRFLQPPVPAEGLPLPCGRVTGQKIRPHRGFPVPHSRDAIGLGASSTPEPVVCAWRQLDSSFHIWLNATVSSIVSVVPRLRRFCRDSRLVHPADLRLALGPVMATFAIRLFAPASHPAVTSSACGTGDWPTHWPGFHTNDWNHSSNATSGRT